MLIRNHNNCKLETFTKTSDNKWSPVWDNNPEFNLFQDVILYSLVAGVVALVVFGVCLALVFLRWGVL